MFLRMMTVAAAILLPVATGAVAQVDLAAAFGAREQLEDVSLSPDGTRLAYIVPTSGQGSALLTVALGKDAKPAVALTVDGNPERIASCNWIADDRLACTIHWVAKGAPRILPFSRMIAVDADGGNPRLLSKGESLYSHGFALGGGRVIDWLPEENGMVLMSRVQIADDRLGTRLASNQSGTIVEKIDTRTMAASKVEPVREGAQFLSDGHGTVRVMGVEQYANQLNSGIRHYFYRVAGSRDWKLLSDYNYVTETGFYPQAVDYERNAVYGFRKTDGRQALYRMALDGSMKEELVLARPDVDVDGIIRIGRRNRVVGASYATDVRHAVYFDPDLAKLSSSLSKALPKQPTVRIVDSSSDEKKLLIWAGSDDDPGVYYVLDRATRQMAVFQPVRPQLEGVGLAKVQSISYPAADGTMVPGYLTLPAGSSGKGLPAIVLPHGGPSARDEWGFDWLPQYFAARGYAVLQPNYRGSSGYGDAWFQENGFRSWKIAIGDITDAGRWLVSQGIAAPGKLAIVGWSYGGYAALQSAVVDPGLFKAVVAIAPVTDLAALKQESRWWSDYDIVRDFIGSGSHIRDGSPAQNAARIKAPILLFHGTMDSNVDVAQSRLMAARLADVGAPHQLTLFKDRDHYLEDAAVRTQLLSESEAFLRKNLGM